MSGSPSLRLKALFGKAFLAEIQRGDIELAILFARAFLVQENRPLVNLIEEPLIPLLV